MDLYAKAKAIAGLGGYGGDSERSARLNHGLVHQGESHQGIDAPMLNKLLSEMQFR